MKFCVCGKLMTKTDFGYECVCGRKTDNNGNPIDESELRALTDEAARIAAIKAKYHSKYPNMSDPVVRVTEPVAEDPEEDETFSSLRPSERRKKRLH